MSAALEIISWICLVSGALCCVVGGVGLLRMPDVYTRNHASGINDTLGAGLILVGLMCQSGLTLVTVKLAMVLLFMLLIGPIVSHALLKAAYAHGVKAHDQDKEVDDGVSH